MMKKQTKVVLSLLVTIVTLLGYDTYSNHQLLSSVKSGDRTLVCQVSSGTKEIQADLIVKFDPEFGWVFTNGSAKNCSVN